MNWKKEPLGKICKTTSGGTPSRKNQSYYQNGIIPWVKSGELENNIITTSEEFITEEGLLNSSAKIFPAGTLLIALYGATIGKLAFLGIEASTNQAVCGIFQNEKVSLKYLYYYLLFQRPSLIKQGVGGAQPNISQAILKKTEVLYPDSIREQQRIVSNIEKLFSELDKAVDTLKTTKEQLAVYRQAVLKDAFDNAQAMCERFTPIEELLVTDRKGMSTGPFGTMLKKHEHKTTGVPMLGIENIDSGKFIDGNKIFVTPEKATELKSFALKSGDIIISRSGTVGELCVVPPRMEGALLSTNLMRVSLDCQKVLPEYFIYLFQSKGIVLDQVKELCKGSTRIFLNQTILKQIQFPIPNVHEQLQIINTIESRLTFCDNIEKTVDTALAQADAMRQSILKQSFEGKF